MAAEVYNRIVLFLFVLLAQATWRTNWAQVVESAKKEHRMIVADWDERGNFAREPAEFDQLSDVIFVQLGPGASSFVQDTAGAPHPAGGAAYLLYDPDGRERMRIAKNAVTREAIEKIRFATPAFLKVADLLDAKHDLEGTFLTGVTYNRLRMAKEARAAFADAAKLAAAGGDNAAAQLADVQSAFTYAYDGNPTRAVDLLKELTTKAANRDNEAIIWLTLGRAYESAHDAKSAGDAYSKAQSLAAPGSRTALEAAKALSGLH